MRGGAAYPPACEPDARGRAKAELCRLTAEDAQFANSRAPEAPPSFALFARHLKPGSERWK